MVNSTAMRMDAPASFDATLLPRLEALSSQIEGAPRRELDAVVTALRRELEATQRRHDELSVAQAKALVNSAMMMSELQSTHQKLELARRNAESASVAKSEFLANMSHEIRTPINGVLGMNEILQRTELSPKQHHCVSTIRSSVEALLQVINDILDFSKIEAGKLQLHETQFDLRDLIEDIVGLYADTAQRKGLELNAVLPPDLVRHFVADNVRLRQVMTNLLGNAIKFTHCGEIVLRAAVQSTSGAECVVRFEVSDTGIGIAAEARERIFESFAQADGTTEREYGGTGLGLTISSQLVQLMGGEIGVESELNKGATFWFTVRMRRDPSPLLGDDMNIRALCGLRVLAVDDNETNRAIYHDQLTFWNCDFEIAADAGEALKKLRHASRINDPFELVILDMHMPRMNGIALAGAIVADPSIPTPYQLMLSSIGDQLEAQQYRNIGIDKYLTKPIRQADLFRCLRIFRNGGAGDDVPVAVRDDRQFVGHVLVAEDNMVNKEVVLDLLELAGLSVHAVADGLAAVAAAKQRSYDLILMDCQMPKMNGFAATRTIREFEARASTKRAPIVALTANALEGDRERCLNADMDDYLCKPFTDAALRVVLARWLSARSDQLCEFDLATASAVGTPVQTDSAESLVDFAALAHFEQREATSHNGILKRIVGAYIDQSTVQFGDLRAGLDSRRGEEIARVAHALKSSCAVIGAFQLAELCSAIESGARNNDIDNIAQHVVKALGLHQAVCAILKTRYAHCLETA